MPLSPLEDNAIARAEDDIREARMELAVADIRAENPLTVRNCLGRVIRKLNRAEETLFCLRRESAAATAVPPITPPRPAPIGATRPPFPGAEEEAPLELPPLASDDSCGDPACLECGDEAPGVWSGERPIPADATGAA